MKNRIHHYLIIILSLITNLSLAQERLQGAWTSSFETRTHQSINIAAIIEEQYVVITYYSAEDGSFIRTLGGSISTNGENMQVKIEFDSERTSKIGETLDFHFKLVNNKMKFENSKEVWKRTAEEAVSPITGKWVMTSHNGKTIKNQKSLIIASNSRYQWICYDTDSHLFKSTKGGTYVLENGKYKELTEFYSESNDLVGEIASFEYQMAEDSWHQIGTNIEGEAIDDFWKK